MGLLHLCVFAAMMLLGSSGSAESVVVIRFRRAPAAKTRLSNAVFQYAVETQDGSNACSHNHCSVYYKLDGESLRPCSDDTIILKNLTANREHKLLLHVTTQDGEKNSSTYSWFIDRVPPTATISSEQKYTNAEKIAIEVTFSKACTRRGGFKCFNSSNCDVLVNGPAHVQASSLRIIKPNIKYSLQISLSSKNRRPVQLDWWTSVPSYELGINGVPRTVLATNKMENLEFFLDFSNQIANTTEQVLKALHVNSGNLIAIRGKSHRNRRFVFKLNNISETEIITVRLQAASLISMTGTPVTPAAPIIFLYDSTKPGVALSTSSAKVTKEFNINVVVEFTKPVFGFEASAVEVEGGRIIRFEELSRALYSLTIRAASQKVVSVIVPAEKVIDVSGNPNLASNLLEVKQYSAPAISIALHSFVTVGVFSTSLAAALLSLSSANLGVIGAVGAGDTTAISDPSMNLHGMVGHLQAFVLSDWFSVSLPVEYSETIKGLRWLIPREKLPWEKESTSVWPNHFHLDKNKWAIKFSGMPIAYLNPERAYHSIGLISENFSSFLSCRQLYPAEIFPNAGWLHRRHNVSMKNSPYGLPLNSNEYFTYFLRGEPLSASNVVKRMENYTGWQDLKMNLFWLSVGAGSLLTIHFLILIFLRWRTGTSAHGILSVPRFELFLLILMLPCISQSSAFVIRGGTSWGILAGTVLLAIPAAFILSVFLFLIVAVYPGTFVRYKEVKHTTAEEQWYMKPWAFFTGKPTNGKWFYREGVPSSFLPRFGILFESCKGPPLFFLDDQTDPNSVSTWIESSQSGIGRMKAISSNDSNEETKVPMSKRLSGFAKSSYIIIDLLRRAGLGILSGAYSSQGSRQGFFALTITVVQFLYLFTLKPYIVRRVYMVESVSLLCEAGIFGLSTGITGSNPIQQHTLSFIMPTLLFLSFISLITNEWYTLIKWLLRMYQPQNNSFKLGLKCAAKGLILPFLPRQQWSSFIHGYSQPKTGQAPILPLGPERGSGNVVAPHINPLSAMTATIVPMLSPESPSLNAMQRTVSTTTDIVVSGQKTGGGKQPKGLKMGPSSELKKLRELAKASFPGTSMGNEASTSYGQRGQSFSIETPLDDFKPSSSKHRK
ncbi:uncharacterized protein LOC131167504 [Malania oleifera]|uniref:uncharacterized protein LOC131167504 n=1 Tax=Malania oleifera TaxID=397392 RepID=UPI0025AE1880|nr:uncharacterized protein LOC131167504 [Malania oleifera]